MQQLEGLFWRSKSANQHSLSYPAKPEVVYRIYEEDVLFPVFLISPEQSPETFFDFHAAFHGDLT
jgi:hypothetical protein